VAKYLTLATMILTSGCATSGGSLSLQAVCDAWRGAIVVTEPADRRALREAELSERLAQKAACQ